MPKTIEGLVFDKDGTLFDFHATWGVWCHGFITEISDGDSCVASALADVFEYDFANGAFYEHSGFIAGTLDDVLDQMHAVLGQWQRQDLHDFILRSSAEAPQQPVADLKAVLGGLKQNALLLGLATNDNEAPARAHLKSVDILQQFDFVSGCDSGFGAKPGAGMLLAFCDATGLTPDKVAMVGDSTHDLIAGRAAGMTNIGVLTGPAKAEDLAPFADVILQDISGIPDWLGRE